jgi:non-heme chloroperoxidase
MNEQAFPAPRVHRVARTEDGLDLAIQEWGDPHGREVLFIHGGMSNHLCWERQLTDPRLTRARLVAYDLRGHGDSGRPVDPETYAEGARWGRDLRAVIDSAGLERPVVVAWSLAGIVVSAYLQLYGDERLAGVNWVGAIPAFVPELGASFVMELIPRLASPHAEERFEALVAWFHACYKARPLDAMHERLLAAAGSALAMAHTIGIPSIADPSPALRAFARPALVTQGAKDRLTPPATAHRLAELLGTCTLSVYEDAGHACFADDPDRFNRELAAFVERCHGGHGS